MSGGAAGGRAKHDRVAKKKSTHAPSPEASPSPSTVTGLVDAGVAPSTSLVGPSTTNNRSFLDGLDHVQPSLVPPSMMGDTPADALIPQTPLFPGGSRIEWVGNLQDSRASVGGREWVGNLQAQATGYFKRITRTTTAAVGRMVLRPNTSPMKERPEPVPPQIRPIL